MQVWSEAEQTTILELGGQFLQHAQVYLSKTRSNCRNKAVGGV